MPRFRSAWTVLCLAGLLTIGGCAGSSRYTDTSQIDDLTAGISDTDVKMLGNKIVQDLLAAGFIEYYDKPVTISLLPITNNTSEFIDTDSLFGQSIMEAIVNSGSGVFQFVDRSMIEESLKEAELAADGLISQAEATKLGRMAGVTLLMNGDLTSIRTVVGKTDQRYYKLALKLVDSQRNTIVWTSSEDIRKTSKKGWMQ